MSILPSLDPPTTTRPPFDTALLDALLEQAGLDAVVATSPHNVRYLLGDADPSDDELAGRSGHTRALPALAYRRGEPADALYVGPGDARLAADAAPPWVADVRSVSWSATATGEELVRWAARLPRAATVGVELAYLPTEAYACFAARGVALLDAGEALEELRAVKRPHELERVRRGANAVADAMLATLRGAEVGDARSRVAERLRQEQTVRGLTFRYALVGVGAERAQLPSRAPIWPGDVVALESGGTLDGWVAELARMGVAGEPSARHRELLAQVEHVQEIARTLARPGVRGGDLVEAGRAAIAECGAGAQATFSAHGSGLLAREAPHLTPGGAQLGPAAHAGRPLRAGMVLSLASQVADPELGFVRLRDLVIVTDGEPELVAGHGRGWNRLGALR
jgi:Xaa-Pro dipeptidase